MWDVKSGDLVVCIDGDEWTRAGTAGPRKGLIYTVVAMYINPRDKAPYLELEEWPGRDLWWIECFRPVAKPSIESLRSLTNEPDLVDAQ